MKRSKNKQIAAVLLILAVIITQIPPVPVKAQKQSDFVVDDSTLLAYEGTEGAVTIPNYIKVIGREAFENNGSLVSVRIPSSVEVIEAGAFARCRNLSSVSIPSSVVDIAPSAFAGCDRLGSVSIDRYNPEYICENGTILTADRRKIVQVLAGREGHSYTIPASVDQIDRYAFWGCDHLTSVQMGRQMTSIPAYAFSNMPYLEDITIPDSVSEIDTKAFEDCTSLKEVYLSPTVTRIHPTAFDGCRNLHITSVEGTVADRFYQNFLMTNTLLENEESDDEDSFFVEPQQTSVRTGTVSGDRIGSVSQNAGTAGRADEAVSYDGKEILGNTGSGQGSDDGAGILGRTKIVGGRAVVFVDNSKMQVQEGANRQQTVSNPEQSDRSENGAKKQDVGDAPVLPEETSGLMSEIPDTKMVIAGNSIADRAFYKEESLLTYQIPAGVTEIGDFSFARSALTQINIPSGVTRIGYGAFYNCKDLTNVSIPSTVTNIEPSAFLGTAWMERFRNGGDLSDFLIVGDGILLAYKGISQNVTIPEGIKVIGPEVFKNHSEIQTVSLPESLRRIDEEAFAGCSTLENVAGGSKLEAVKDRAFYGCNLQTVRIPESVETIGLLAYGNMPGTESVVFLGDQLPKISYEKTATRLANAEYRKSPFEGIHAFVVPSSAKSFDDTVLKNGAMGYNGVICSVMKEPTLQEKGEVDVRKVSVSKDGTPAQIPQSIWIYGKEYYVTNTETDAYEVLPEETDKETARSEEEDSAQETSLSSQTAGDTEEEKEALPAAQPEGNLSVKVTKKDWKEVAGIYADMTVDGSGYELTLSDQSSGELEEALKNQGISTDSLNFTPFDMKLTELQSLLPISRLGTERVTVCLPIAKIYQNEPVVAVSLDGNGQLEYLSCIHHSTDGQEYVLFDVKHFSPYGILCGDQVPKEYQDAYFEKVAAKKAADYDSKLGKKDDSPDTGDSMQPKWFLAAGIFFLAVFFFLKKPKME